MSAFPNEVVVQSTIRLNQELIAVGIVCSGVDSNGQISDLQTGQEVLAALVLAAKDKALSSPECQAVKTALGGQDDPRWIAYKQVRQDIKEQKRNEKYKDKILNILVDAVDNITWRPDPIGGGKIPTFKASDIQLLKDAIATIKTDIPDEV